MNSCLCFGSFILTVIIFQGLTGRLCKTGLFWGCLMLNHVDTVYLNIRWLSGDGPGREESLKAFTCLFHWISADWHICWRQKVSAMQCTETHSSLTPRSPSRSRSLSLSLIYFSSSFSGVVPVLHSDFFQSTLTNSINLQLINSHSNFILLE